VARLAVVCGEGDGQDVLGVAQEAAGGGAGVDVPEAEGAVPGARQAEGAVRGDDDVLPGRKGWAWCESEDDGRYWQAGESRGGGRQGRLGEWTQNDIAEATGCRLES
jgi:hypothetical protein